MNYFLSEYSCLCGLTLYACRYFVFDCPGQVELYTHHNSLRNVIDQIVKKDYRLTAVHLVDAHYCSNASKYISVLMTSLATMLHMNLPHVNVLSKMDLAEQFGKYEKFGISLLITKICYRIRREGVEKHVF